MERASEPFGGGEGWRHHRFEREMGADRDFDRHTTATAETAMTGIMDRTGAAPNGSDARSIGLIPDIGGSR